MKLENWSIGIDPKSMYDNRPGYKRWYLRGVIFGHPEIDDGVKVSTSNIQHVDGRQVTTNSGSIYVLGEPIKEYDEWCRVIGKYVPTPEEPIKLISHEDSQTKRRLVHH